MDDIPFHPFGAFILKAKCWNMEHFMIFFVSGETVSNLPDNGKTASATLVLQISSKYYIVKS